MELSRPLGGAEEGVCGRGRWQADIGSDAVEVEGNGVALMVKIFVQTCRANLDPSGKRYSPQQICAT